MNGHTAIITGGSRGIGKGIAECLAKRGINVVVAATKLEAAEETSAALIGFGVKSIAVKTDIAKSSDVSALFEKAVAEFGRVDILVNNAGITRDGLLLRMKEEDWDSVIDTNLKGTFLCSKEAIKLMSKQRYGRIINITSIVAFIGNAGQTNYSASKAGIVGLTKSIAKEYASRGITVNAVAPGFITTAMTDVLSDNVKQEMMKAIPMGKFGSVEDIANAVAFLASPDTSYITGQVIHVNGGMYM
ncbi:MAG: 3-oxoacyl-[acyl-carrier-protein] reductase [Nitrospirae bacterium]|nr:3-oxoacyl-[acyl-carrier-protein] reductase [Nitrospirota bacterium]